MPWIQTNPRSWGSSITPNFEGLGVSPEVVIAFLNGLKKDGQMEPTVSQIWRLQPPRNHQKWARTRCKYRCCPARAGPSNRYLSATREGPAWVRS